MMRRNELIEFYQLVVTSLEGSATDAQYATLIQKVKEDDQAARFYAELLSIYANLACPSLAEPVFQRLHDVPPDLWQEHVLSDDIGIWNALLRMERTAPAVETEKPEKNPGPDKTKPAQVPPEKPNKYWMHTSLVASAALILLFLYASICSWYLPREVATVTDCIHAKLTLAEDPLRAGDRLYNRTEALRLERGMVKITFDSGAEVILEGPAIFSCASAERLNLQLGKGYIDISTSSGSFIVDTPNSEVTDIGTAFGVHALKHGDAIVQIYEGKAALTLKSSKRTRKRNAVIEKGQARHVSFSRSEITEIPFEPRTFVTSSDYATIRDNAARVADGSVTPHPALCLHLDASRSASVIADATDTVSRWVDVSNASPRHDAVVQLGSATYIADGFGNGLGAVDFGNPDPQSGRTQMSLMSQRDSKAFLDQTELDALGFTVALVVRVQSHAKQDWCNIIGNTTIIDVPAFFVRWHTINAKPMAAAFLGGRELWQDCAPIGETVVLVCRYDRKGETFSLWNSYSNQTTRVTVKAGDFAASDDTEPVSDLDHHLYLGAFGRNKARYFDGLIGEVRVYSQALDAGDLMTLKDELVEKWKVTLPEF